VDVGEPRAGDGAHRVGDRLDGAQVAPFAHVRDALEKGICHGAVSYP
jgi:hypothetical protein